MNVAHNGIFLKIAFSQRYSGNSLLFHSSVFHFLLATPSFLWVPPSPAVYRMILLPTPGVGK